jgi:hypothetical protein
MLTTSNNKVVALPKTKFFPLERAQSVKTRWDNFEQITFLNINHLGLHAPPRLIFSGNFAVCGALTQLQQHFLFVGESGESGKLIKVHDDFRAVNLAEQQSTRGQLEVPR